MQIKHIVVTGEAMFLRRYRPVFESLALYCDRLDYLAGDEPFQHSWLNEAYKFVNKIIYAISPLIAGQRQKNGQTFIAKSQQLQRRIEQLPQKPDFVLHVFGMYCPFWQDVPIPYGMYLDYTMALARRNWAPWAPFAQDQDFAAWKDCERSAYTQASRLFTMSNIVKLSLIQDYGIDSDKISVVGSFANRHGVYAGEKSFGRKQILFNGADFKRKGGDIVLAAFEQVKQKIPEAKLVIIGRKLNLHREGVDNPGRIGSLEDMRQLFLQTDLVVAPGRCDPFPSFVIEAMNYGVPCIVSGKDGMPEIVDDGMTGLVIDPTTPDTLAAELIRLLSDRPTLERMSQNARKKAAEQLNCDHVAQKIMQSLLS
jgi:glycogen synthase